ncbi:uracil/xanthine transporter [Metabacillus halosaccharovorans]|uniref:uracil/xanthine transporter n=1 Tax=Metabacillus halosaccharovorans TaxID=930124 RepID=UPI00203D97B9|nr:uracil/xanthine transporter [Metabacillus halosaccharovorans]MCM3439886.1 uracil/xanthine transporter [Metabacillus halosaccharovorans]
MKNLSSSATIFASLQWLFFIFANTIVVPISIGTAFDLPYSEISMILRSSLVFTGIACLLQGLIGHRYPLMEGHSGIMWGLMLNLCVIASSTGTSLQTIGGGIASGLLLAGIVVLILGSLKLISFIQKVFTPMVMSVYLFLLTFQLILIFFKGMLKFTPDGKLDIPVSLFSLGVVLLVCLIKIKGKAVISNFAILIGIVVGWVFYLILFPAEQSTISQSTGFGLHLFPLGTPNLNIGIIAITFLASFINLSNTIASVSTASTMFNDTFSQSRLDRSYLLNGAYSIVSALFGLVPYAPFASSIGFLESTRIFQLRPYLIGGGLMVLLGSVPFLGGLLATLPVTVGNAVLFVAYFQLFGTSLRSIHNHTFNSITIHRLAIPVLVGVCIMNMDADTFNTLPSLIQPLVSNGFIMGVLLSILLEMFVKWEKGKVQMNEVEV